MRTASQELMDLASAQQGNVSDYRLHKLSGFAQSTVSKWRTGAAHMGPDAVTKFCELAGTKDLVRWHALVAAEREQGPDGDVWRALRDELTLSEKAGKPVRGGMIDALVRTIAGKAAGILLAGCVAWAAPGDAFALENKALSRSAPPAGATAFVYYGKYRVQLPSDRTTTSQESGE